MHMRNWNGKQKNKHGFTLVEVLVAIALIGIISLWVAEMIGYISNAKTSVTGKNQVREDAEYASNCIQMQLRNSKGLVNYQAVATDDDGKIVSQVKAALGIDYDKYLPMILKSTTDGKYTVIWRKMDTNKGECNLYMVKNQTPADAAKAIESVSIDNLLCKKANTFQFDYADSYGKSVSYTLKCVSGKSEYELKNAVYLPNVN